MDALDVLVEVAEAASAAREWDRYRLSRYDRDSYAEELLAELEKLCEDARERLATDNVVLGHSKDCYFPGG